MINLMSLHQPGLLVKSFHHVLDFLENVARGSRGFQTCSSNLPLHLQYRAIQYSTVSYPTRQRNTVQRCTVHPEEYSTVQYITVQYSISFGLIPAETPTTILQHSTTVNSEPESALQATKQHNNGDSMSPWKAHLARPSQT